MATKKAAKKKTYKEVKITRVTTPTKDSCSTAAAKIKSKDMDLSSDAGRALGKCSGKSRAKKASTKKAMYKRAGVSFK